MRRLTVVCLLGGAAAMAAVVVPSALGLPGALAAAVTLASVASLLLAVSLSAVGALLSSAAPPDRQGTVLGNNAALLVLGEVVGVSGGSFIAGIDPMLPLLVLAVLAAAAPAVLSRPQRHTAGARSPRTGP